MTTPIEKMMDEVEWTDLPTQFIGNGPLVAVREGKLKIGNFEFKVFQLSDGQRVIDGEDVENFFKAL